jgi:SAM-dependent methyltransferase
MRRLLRQYRSRAGASLSRMRDHWSRSTDSSSVRDTAKAGVGRTDPSDYTALLGIGTIVPCQIEAYFTALNCHANDGDRVLDVGFGLGYGLNIMAIKASVVDGVEIDPKALDYCMQVVAGRNPRLRHLALFSGYDMPFEDAAFDLVTCVDVLEHVADYDRLRVTSRGVFLSTPNRRSEYTMPDGTPKNRWHLREWSYEELDQILRRHGLIDWHFLNGPFDGPFRVSDCVQHDTLALSPFLAKGDGGQRL